MSLSSITLTLNTQEDTQRLAQRLAGLDLSGSVWLSGDLGAGKTTLTRYWLQALGHQGAVKSPTYTLVEPYAIAPITTSNTESQAQKARKLVYHADLYRLQDPEELSFIGFDEYLDDPDALVIIEWASRADEYLPPPHLFIDIRQIDDKQREVTLQLSKAGMVLDIDLAVFNDFV